MGHSEKKQVAWNPELDCQVQEVLLHSKELEKQDERKNWLERLPLARKPIGLSEVGNIQHWLHSQDQSPEAGTNYLSWYRVSASNPRGQSP